MNTIVQLGAVSALFLATSAAPTTKMVNLFARQEASGDCFECTTTVDQPCSQAAFIESSSIVDGDLEHDQFQTNALALAGGTLTYESGHAIGTTITYGGSIGLSFGEIFAGDLAATYEVSMSTEDSIATSISYTCPAVDPPQADPLDNWQCNGLFIPKMVETKGYTYLLTPGANPADGPGQMSPGCVIVNGDFTAHSPHINPDTGTAEGAFRPCICPKADGSAFPSPPPVGFDLCPFGC
ncbi:hypothetical protein LTR56_010677 [Elasticomyces elasticus]|nr:hypothetical protein LTR56_010677 [Elasticomyces elasticus]KAK3655390.1 hypothetical protein LTR22_010275 [Elasticomyces elasticus]KAK4922124.1 hypothetical protein LTR49_010535 [Elasticomyces elasticus]KAK5751555.1 hypothetical protein LTS12_018397 [Elasticomyces elasticus]